MQCPIGITNDSRINMNQIFVLQFNSAKTAKHKLQFYCLLRRNPIFQSFQVTTDSCGKEDHRYQTRVVNGSVPIWVNGGPKTRTVNEKVAQIQTPNLFGTGFLAPEQEPQPYMKRVQV